MSTEKNTASVRDNHMLQDKGLTKTNVLPTADGTAYSTGIDLSAALGAKDARLADCEFVLSIPDLTVTHLPDGDTLKFAILGDTALPIDGSSIVMITEFLSMLGAGGVGDGPEVKRFRLPSDWTYQYIGVVAVAAGGTGDISAISMTTALVF